MSSNRIIKWLYELQQRWKPPVSSISGKNHPRPRFDTPESALPEFVQRCPVTMRYYRWFRQINWAAFPERSFDRDYPQMPVSYAAFAAACLVKIDQQFSYMSQLRRYLVDHPALVWLLGFRLHFSITPYWGFDADKSLPTQRHLTQMLRKIPNHRFQFLLDETVRLLRKELKEEAPDFGQQISLDTKHILAWVKENNLNTRVSNRYDKTKQPKGDPDCKLGFKATENKSSTSDSQDDEQEEPATPTTNPKPASKQEVGQFYWGYASGVVATKVPAWGEFVLAEFTQPFNCSDISYFEPLMAATTARMGFKPRFGAFDAAFDAFYVYDYFYRPEKSWETGFAAVPFSRRNVRHKTFDEHGHPHCEADLVMTLKYTFTSRATRVEHERGHYVCPLASQEDATCPIDHKRWAKGGCTHRIPTNPGARLRHQIDRDSELYQTIYDQRTATERINSQAKELGIERPYLRNRQSITNQNTLIYVVLNLRALQRVQHRRQKIATDN
jgi:hypothetical protein